ncbi:HTH-type transcriptional activator IlvY [Exilibacterium tricleocarpae]|uniref:HTH-type transcriptional activator IlvY n=1 Tax=Exilibacterium tricleocarpae TaxID=2591008 RepID=A0A545T1Z2_9GAMM|nr:HTH-type transcriptional activator IlvY [Exilibacterium tricleocarpae]TQV71212.1 HTH-type transcriptional activator IlvY [Exilibacterium tricleocarpae]
MDNRSLKLFLSLSETLHFGRSSEACHISPSALSRTIKQMEAELGVTLFERDNRTVALTHAGGRLQHYARDTLLQWDSFRDSLLNDSRELRGEISIYCSVTASYSFLYDILSEFRPRHPKIEIKLHTGDPTLAISRVTAGLEDIAIAARPDKLPHNLDFRRVTVSPLVFITASTGDSSASLPSRRSAPQTWADIPMILSEEGLIRERVDAWFQQQGIAPRIYAQVAGHEAIVSMVSLGFGIGVVPKIVLDNSPLSRRVKVLPDQPQLAAYEVGVCALKKRLKSPLLSALWGQIHLAETS